MSVPPSTPPARGAFERLAVPFAGLLLALLLLVPAFTARRLSAASAELARVSAGRRALADLQREISQTTANALTPLQDSATQRRLSESLARSDSAAARLRSAIATADKSAASAVALLLQRLAASKRGPRQQVERRTLIVASDDAAIDRSTRLTELLDASRIADSALALGEQHAIDRMAVVQRQGDVLTVALGVVTASIAVLLGGLSRRLRRATAELETRAESEARARAAADLAVTQRDQVLRIVSHDLKNPLHTIGMAASLATDPTIPPDDRAKQFGVITRSVDRMRRLVNDLLDVARLESGHALAIAPAEVRLHDLLREAGDAFADQARSRGVSLDVQPARDDTRVMADRGRVMQVLANLVGNAIKFTPPNGTVQLRAEPEGTTALVSVSNSGPAIAPEVLDHLFKPFSQAKETASLGTGLGLSIAKGIVEAHGGRMHVSSGPGEPTTFAFTLPIAAPANTARSPSRA